MTGEEQDIGLRSVKSRARELLPEGDACRALILSQPDNISKADGVMLAKVLSRLLSDEFQ